MREASTTTSSLVRVFDDNARTYDRVNTLVSLGLDARWRRWAASRAVQRPGARVLDAFAGTGLVGLEAARLGALVTLADASPGMLEQARRYASRDDLPVVPYLADLTADPLDPLPGAPFDAITVVFGVRYLDDAAAVLGRLASTVAPGGVMVVVDFVEPGRSPVSRLAAVYFFRILPKIAGLLSGRPELYRLLTSTTHRLGGRDRLAQLVEAAGLQVTEVRSMGFGLVTGVVARPSRQGADGKLSESGQERRPGGHTARPRARRHELEE